MLMKLYFTVIGIAMVLISALNIGFRVAAAHYAIIAVVFCTALQFVLDAVVAFVVNRFPDKCFGIDNPLFSISEWERNLYKRLKVRLWATKVWELGSLGGFSKKSVKEPDNPEYIEKFIIECNKGVMTHRLSYPVGFLAMLTLPGIPAFTIALPVAVVNLFLNILPTIVLRHNTPMLKSLLKRLKRKKERNETELAHKGNV